VVRFIHRIFFEYFVVRGIANRRTSGDYAPWMNLVLNVDMRKLLREMIEDDEWYEGTKKSYALDSEGLKTWEFKDKIDFNELEEERRFLLQFMTDPEHEKYMKDADGKLAQVFNRFFEKESLLHPRYLMYTYEAVAIYVWHHKWDEQGKTISDKFSKILLDRLNQIYEILLKKESENQHLWELLLERILHIGHNLRYIWARELSMKKDEILTLIRDENTKKRIESIFTNIDKALF